MYKLMDTTWIVRRYRRCEALSGGWASTSSSFASEAEARTFHSSPMRAGEYESKLLHDFVCVAKRKR